MEYKLTLFSVIKAILFNVSMDLVLVPIFIIVPLMFVLFRKYASNTNFHYFVVLYLIISSIVSFVMVVMVYNLTESGYSLKNNILSVRAPFSSKDIDLTSATVKLVCTEEWRLERKISGINLWNLFSGYFRLANGEKAMVFRYGQSVNSVVIVYKNQNYLITHPGVENLYEKINDKSIGE